MKALISENERDLVGNRRVAQVVSDDNIFEVSEGLFWVSCEDFIKADAFWYSSEGFFLKKPDSPTNPLVE